MSAKSILLSAAAAAVVALAGGVTAASAHGHGGHGHMGHGHMGHHHFFHHRFGPRVFVGGGYSDCGYLYNRWTLTGSYYWKRRYLQCRYGW
jgi:hypothetical protein